MNRTAPLLVALLVGCPSGSDGNKDTSGDDGGGGALGGLPSHAVATVAVTACGGSVPQARSFHHAAWFFLTTPVQVTAGRWVERGFVVTGGWSEASGALLNDLWLFDLTNAGASDCPWVNLGTSGPGAASGSLSWDPTRQRLLYAGGFSEGSTAEYTSDGVYTATVQDLADGLGWTSGGAVSTASEVVSLTVDATRGAAWPSWFRPLANDDLVPDAVPQSGGFVPGRGAYRVCARPGDADCGGDNDSDGWSMDAECDDADPTRNPGAFPGPLSADPADDNNCDGW